MRLSLGFCANGRQTWYDRVTMAKSHTLSVEFLNCCMCKRASVKLPNKGKPIELVAEHDLSSGVSAHRHSVISWKTRSCREGLVTQQAPVELEGLMAEVVAASRMTEEEVVAAKKRRQAAVDSFNELFYGAK